MMIEILLLILVLLVVLNNYLVHDKLHGIHMSLWRICRILNGEEKKEVK